MIDANQSLSFPEVVDSSMLLDLDACAEKWHRHYLQHWGPKYHSVDLHAGGAFAHGIEHVRKSLWRPELKKPIEIALLDGVRELLIYWGDFEPPEGHAKNMINTAGALIDYFREYDPAFDHVKPYYMTNGQPAIEFTFAIPTAVAHPVTGNPILYGGRFDMLGLDYGKRLTVVDEKTTGQSPNSKVGDVHRMRGQFIGYVFAGRYHEFDVWDMLVRIVVIQKTQYKHFAVPLTYQQWQLDRWWDEVHRKVHHAVEQWKAGDWGLSYGEACSSYGGCSFLPLCTMRDPEMWLNDYAQRYWNPLEQDPTRRHLKPEELVA